MDFKLNFHECKWAPSSTQVQFAPEYNLTTNLVYFKPGRYSGIKFGGPCESEHKFFKEYPKNNVYFYSMIPGNATTDKERYKFPNFSQGNNIAVVDCNGLPQVICVTDANVNDSKATVGWITGHMLAMEDFLEPLMFWKQLHAFKALLPSVLSQICLDYYCSKLTVFKQLNA